MTNFRERPDKNSWSDVRDWADALEKELLSELEPKINPQYSGWSTLETDAEVKVYLRVLGITKSEAWIILKKRGLIH